MWKCKRCGECCNAPRVYKKDIERIEKLGNKEFVYTDDLGHTYLRDKEGKCMFLVMGKVAECGIYDSRPDTCRKYPSELNNGDCKPIRLAFDDYLEKRNAKKRTDS